MTSNTRVKYGTEGPSSDPWGFCEITTEVTYNSKWKPVVVTGHFGLEEWVKIGGRRYEERASDLFAGVVGVEFDELEELYQSRRFLRCSCGSNRFFDSSGFAGETITVCVDCRKIVRADGRMSASYV